MGYDTELAKLFKERNNKKKIGAIIGKVVNINPIKISILDGQIVLQKEHLYFCSSLLNNYTREFEINNIQGNTNIVDSHSHTLIDLHGNMKLTDTLKINDEVMLIATESGQTFFVIDKVVKI